MYDEKYKENMILGVVVIGTLMASIDSTIVLLAFPAITSALHSNIATIIWVIIIYMIVVAVFSRSLVGWVTSTAEAGCST